MPGLRRRAHRQRGRDGGRGRRGLSTVAARPPAPALRTAAAGGPALPLGRVRGLFLCILALFAGLQWMDLIEPAALVAGVGGGRDRRADRRLRCCCAARLPGRWSQVAAAIVALAAIGPALLAGGLGDEYLRPDRWGDLMAGVGRGLDALPGVRVPYRGLDEWTRAVIGMGGTLLIVLAGLLAFWPRRGRTGFPPLALLLLAHAVRRPGGRARLRRRVHPRRGAGAADDRVPARRAARRQRRAGRRRRRGRRGDRGARHRARDRRPPAVVGLRAVGARHGRRARGRLLLEPRLQPAELAARRPRAAAGQGVDPGLLEGGRPRRVRRPHLAPGPAPAQRGPREPAPGRRRQPGALVAADRGHAAQHPDRHVRHRRHRDRGDRRGRVPDRRRHLQRDRRGSGAATPTRRTSTRRGPRSASCARPAPPTRTGCAATCRCSSRRARAWTSRLDLQLDRVDFPAWGGDREAGDRAVRRRPGEGRPRCSAAASSRARRGLAQELKAEADTPYEYVAAVERYLDDRLLLLRAPAAGVRRTLDGFLFDAKIGFCQQFSGAEALLLRMGGVPARVATGFTSGSFDENEKEFVVRDLDAHSWVEAWFPGYRLGAARPDARRGAAAQPAGRRTGASCRTRAPDARRPSAASASASSTSGRALAPDEGVSTLTWILVGHRLDADHDRRACCSERRRRRRRPPPAARPIAEFERALRARRRRPDRRASR